MKLLVVLDRPGWRLAVARTLAWLLLLCGWVGLGSVVQALASSVFDGFALMALWLLATGVFAEALARWPVSAGMARVALIGTGGVTVVALISSSNGGGEGHLIVLLLAWSTTIALASAAVRACRAVSTRKPGLPLVSGATAAALTWAIVGDPTDLRALCIRLAIGMLAACLGLVLLWPRQATISQGGCRAALFDCALPAWPTADKRSNLQQWPLMLAALVMLPMMCGLPLMLGLCRSETLGPRGVLGIHLAAMFLPALATVRWPMSRRFASQACSMLLAAGAVGSLVFAGNHAWTWLIVAQGAAWSLAWSARLQGAARGASRGPLQGPVAGAAMNALLILCLGFAIGRMGLAALGGWHIALGLGAVSASVLAWLGRRYGRVHRPRGERRAIVGD